VCQNAATRKHTANCAFQETCRLPLHTLLVPTPVRRREEVRSAGHGVSIAMPSMPR